MNVARLGPVLPDHPNGSLSYLGEYRLGRAIGSILNEWAVRQTQYDSASTELRVSNWPRGTARTAANFTVFGVSRQRRL